MTPRSVDRADLRAESHTTSATRPQRSRIRPGSVLLAVAAALLMLALPAAGTALANPTHPSAEAVSVVLAQAESVDAVLENVRNWIMGIAAGLATVFITIGAVLYMSAGGDLGQVEKAKTAFRSAAFGYALALLTPLVLSVLREIVGAG